MSEGAYWCLLVPTGAYWCLWVSVGAYWCLLVSVGAYWCLSCLLVSEGAYWCLRVPNGYKFIDNGRATAVMISRAKVSLQNLSKIQDIGCNIISILGIAEGHCGSERVRAVV